MLVFDAATPPDCDPVTNMVVVSFNNSDNIKLIDIVRKKVCKKIHITGSQSGGVAASNTTSHRVLSCHYLLL
jgi:hypothetical protein